MQVYHVVRQIPEGRVTSYGTGLFIVPIGTSSLIVIYSGHVAKLVGMPHHARHVGQGKQFDLY